MMMMMMMMMDIVTNVRFIARMKHTHTHTPKRKRKKESKKVAVVVVDQKTNKQRNKLTDQSPVRHLHERRHGIYLECLTSPCRRPTVWYREQHQQQHPLQKRASINKKVKAFAFFSFLKILLSSSSFRHSCGPQNKTKQSARVKKKGKKRRIFFVLSVVYEFGINEEKLVREHSRIHHSCARSFLRGFLFTERRRYKERRRKDDINESWCHHHHHYDYHYHYHDDDDGDEQHKQYSI